MKIGITFSIYILFLIANIEGRFLLVNVGDPDVVDDNDGPLNGKPASFGDPNVDDDDKPRENNPEITTDMGTACCREKGVPDICFGYCLKERKAESRAITGICHRWFELIGKCLGTKIPGIIEQPAKIDNTQLTGKMSSCPECCYKSGYVFGCGIAAVFVCKDCPRSRLANQEKNQPNKGGEESRQLIRKEIDCKEFENPDNECRKDSLCSCYTRDGKRMCYGYSSCKNKSGDDPNWGWVCACKRND